MAAAGLPSDWVALRRQARQLESRIDQQLEKYATLSSADDGMTAETDAEERRVASEAARMVDEFRSVTEAMRHHPEAGVPGNARTLKTLARSLQELRGRQTALHAAFERRREADRLFSGRGGAGSDADAERAALAAESGRLRATHRELDEILAGMEATHSTLGEDNDSLNRSRSATERYVARLPLVGGVITSIRDKKKRRQLILAAVIAAVICFFLWFFVLRHLQTTSIEEPV